MTSDQRELGQEKPLIGHDVRNWFRRTNCYFTLDSGILETKHLNVLEGEHLRHFQSMIFDFGGRSVGEDGR